MSDEMIPAGEYDFTLHELKSVSSPNPYSNPPGEMRERLAWEFRTEGGHRFTQWTGTKFGNQAANMTLLMQRMVPGIDMETMERFDLDSLVGTRYRGIIEHKKDENGNMKVNLAYLRPLEEAPPAGKPAPAAKPTPPPLPVPAPTAAPENQKMPDPSKGKTKLTPAILRQVGEIKTLLKARGFDEADVKLLFETETPDYDPAALGFLKEAILAGQYGEPDPDAFADPFESQEVLDAERAEASNSELAGALSG